MFGKNVKLLFILAFVSIITGCMSTTSFQKWSGPNEFCGNGGSYVTEDGIDIYTTGDPNKKFLILGIVNHSILAGGEAIALFGDSWVYSALAKEAKKQGGDAVIMFSSKSNVISPARSNCGSVASSKSQAVIIKYIRQRNTSPKTDAKKHSNYTRQSGNVESITPDDGYAPLDPNAYGPGIHSNRYGEAIELVPDGAYAPGEMLRIKPDAYGPGIHMDQYGRPVREVPVFK